MTASRIPDFADNSTAGMSCWSDEMSQRSLLFHPEDSPADIVDIATGESFFTE